jgi:PIN domain nuclease of toxin-antitoxin system
MPEPVILLDTHCWIWIQFGQVEKFARTARATIEKAARRNALRVSVISVWEIGMLESKGRLELKMNCSEWIRQALATPGLALVPLSPEVAVESSRLPGRFHGDPADRILVATARIFGLDLMTKDDRLLEYGSQRHIRIVPA